MTSLKVNKDNTWNAILVSQREDEPVKIDNSWGQNCDSTYLCNFRTKAKTSFRYSQYDACELG